ncbi:MAG: FAD-binding oxidoreductase [Gammaproteobacteria bacterium]
MAKIHFAGKAYDCQASETVLQALRRHGVDIPFACQHGICQTCLLRSADRQAPAAAQQGLRDTLRAQGYFLACQCRPEQDMEVGPPREAEIYGRAILLAKELLAPRVCRLTVEPATPLYYHAGQFINLRRADGLIRSYSLASVPHRDAHLELHVKRMQNGNMSNWIYDELKPGTALDLQGPNGACFYLPGKPQQNLLLIGTGTGLAPLIGIARDALYSGHLGEVHLYHGSHHRDGLYLMDELRGLAHQYRNFHYHPCVSGPYDGDQARAGRADAHALADITDLAGWRVFLCGSPPMVAATKRKAYLMGANLADIHIDPFEVTDLRRQPR